jgi:4-hydroxybenzoate polyprenyltransferase
MKYLKLVRWPNLLMVAITMYAIRHALIAPILAVNEMSLQMPNFQFFLLVVSTVFITAGGYVINDYFDIRTDRVNRPNEVLIGTSIKRRVAMALHSVLNVVAIFIAFGLSIEIGYWEFGLLFVSMTGLLWYYSTHYKRQFLIGNLIVSFLTAIVPFVVLMYEIPRLNKFYSSWLIENHTNFIHIVRWVLAYSFFAFITNLIREIIKDIEDFEGDAAFGRNTLPVVLGIGKTKFVLYALIVVELTSMITVYFLFLEDIYSLIFFLVFFLLPLLYLIYKIYKANERRHYTLASTLVKFIMLAGILYLSVVYYNLLHL